MEHPPFGWYLSGEMGIFYGYVNVTLVYPEGIHLDIMKLSRKRWETGCQWEVSIDFYFQKVFFLEIFEAWI